MNKIYLNGNYIVVEEVGKERRFFPVIRTDYGEEIDHFWIRKWPNIEVQIIPLIHLSDWTDDVGTVFDITTIKAFLVNNTSSNVGSAIRGNVDFYANLPSATSSLGLVYEVLQGSGGYVVLGKRFMGKDPGYYRSDGTQWIHVSRQEVDAFDVTSDAQNLSWTTKTTVNGQLEDLSSHLDNIGTGGLVIDDLPPLP